MDPGGLMFITDINQFVKEVFPLPPPSSPPPSLGEFIRKFCVISSRLYIYFVTSDQDQTFTLQAKPQSNPS